MASSSSSSYGGAEPTLPTNTSLHQPTLSSLSDAGRASDSTRDGGGADRGDTGGQGHLGRDQEAQGDRNQGSPQGKEHPEGREERKVQADEQGTTTRSQERDGVATGRELQPLNTTGQPAAGARKATVVVQVQAKQPVTPTVANAPDSDDEGPRSEDGDDGDFLSDFPDDTPELELVHCRLASCTSLHLPRFGPYLQKLCLRQNHIKTLDPADWHPLVELEELDLYDNQLKVVDDALTACTKLVSLDLSFNLFRGVPDGLSGLVDLHSIYFVQNKIARIDNLSTFVSLKTLELGGNRIRQIENLDGLVNLEELWLGKNKISRLENLSALTKLRILSIQSNRITKLENLDALSSLEEFYISHNGVEVLEGLTHNTQLRTLDVSANRLKAIENIAHLAQLEELWASSNAIPDLAGLQRECAGLQQLQTVYFEHNPAQRADMVGYRRKMMLALPQIKQIDATFARA